MRDYYSLVLCYLPQPLENNTNLCLNNSSYPTRSHSIIVYYDVKLLEISIGLTHGAALYPLYILFIFKMPNALGSLLSWTRY